MAQEVEDDLVRGAPAFGGDVGDRAPEQVGVGRVGQPADHGLVPADGAVGPLGEQGADRHRVVEPLPQRLVAAGLELGRDRLGERGVAGEVRVDVDPDVEALAARVVDHLQGLGHATPVASPDGGQVRDLGPAPGRASDAEALRHGLQEVVGVVPDVPGEQPVVCGDGAPQRDQLVLLGEADRGVDESGGQTHRAVLEALLEEPDHRVDLGAGGRAGVEADRGGAERAVGDEGEDVEGRPGGANRVQVAADGGPVDGDVGVEIEVGGRGPDLVEVGLRRTRGDAEAAVADDLGGRALGERARRLRGGQQGEVTVGVDVDESRGDDEAARVDDGARILREVGADGDDPVRVDGDVGRPRPAPVPSTSVPPRTRRSIIGRGPCGRSR